MQYGQNVFYFIVYFCWWNCTTLFLMIYFMANYTYHNKFASTSHKNQNMKSERSFNALNYVIKDEVCISSILSVL